MNNRNTHGGARKGAGRKPENKEPTTGNITLRLPLDLIAKLDRLTGNRSAWVAERIKRAKEP